MYRFTFVMSIVLLFVFSVFPQSLQAQNAVPVVCGDIVEASFTAPESFVTFALELSAGDMFYVETQRLGDSLRFNVWRGANLGTAIFAPAGGVIISGSRLDVGFADFVDDIRMETGILDETGEYAIRLLNNDIAGTFQLRVGCTLRDGTVIEPGDTVSADSSSNNGVSVQIPAEFSGFGFIGLAPVDFSGGIELPLALGQPQVAPVASDVALYTYAAGEGEVATLSISRASGDISIGVTVINRDTNEIIFLGGLPSSNNLSVELTFPAAGTYAIGLFRLDTAERVDTSGAVQITLE